MMRCKYARKPCPNMRSVKTNGELHSLCQLHRRRANEIQLRWYTRQQQATPGATSYAPPPPQEVPQAHPDIHAARRQSSTEHQTASAAPPGHPAGSAGESADDWCDLLSEDLLLEFLEQIDLDDGADSPTNGAVFGAFARRL